MNNIFQLPIAVKMKKYECLICLKDIRKRIGFCVGCAEKILEEGRVICERCGKNHFLSNRGNIMDIHPSAAAFPVNKSKLRGKLFFFGACKECDPEFQIQKVKAQQFSIS